MVRHRLLVFTFAGLIALEGGCANVRERLGATGQREPLIQESREQTREALDEPTEEPEKSTSERPPAIAEHDPQSSPMDPATRMLIDTELKDLPSDERRAWRRYLASIQPERIPEVLQSRRTHPTLQPGDEQLPIEVVKSTSRDSHRTETVWDKRPDELFPPGESHEESGIRAVSALGDETATKGDAVTPSVAMSLTDSPQKVGSPSTGESAPPLNEQSAAAEMTASSGRSAFDSIKIWPQGLRGDRKFAERFAGAKLPLPASWQRHESEVHPPTPPAISEPVVEPPRANPKAAYWEDELQKLISVMEAEVGRTAADTLADQEAHIQRQVYLRMLYLMAAEPEKAQLPITGTDPAHQEFWTSIFWGMSNYFDETQLDDPATQAAQTISQLNSAVRHLQQLADLELRGVTFCQKIDGWGQYDRFEQNEFEPGQLVLLYAEIKNFQSEPTPEGLYRTRIAPLIEIVRVGGDGQLVAREELRETVDLCRATRTDYYSGYPYELPAHLKPGDYELRLTVEDKLSQRFANQTVGFRVR